MREHESGPAVGPQVIFAMDAAGVCTLSVGAGLHDLGLAPGQLVGKNLLDVYAADEEAVDSLRRALGGKAFTVERDFGGRRLSVYYEPTLDDGGRITGVLGVSTDVTRQRHVQALARTARERAGLLADVSAALTREELDGEARLEVTLDALTASGSDLALAWLYSRPEGLLRPGTVRHRSGPIRVLSEELPGWEPVRLDEDAVRVLLRTRASDLRATEIPPPGQATGPESLLPGLAERFGLRTALRVPLLSRGILVGVVDIARTEESGGFGPDDVRLACDIAERCAVALDNARLLQAQREAREDLVKFQALADASPNLVAISDIHNRVVYMNPRARTSPLSIDEDDAWGTVAALAGHRTRDEVLRTLEEAGRWSDDVVIPLPNGRMTMSVDALALRHPDTGGPLGTAWIGQDVTELRRTAAALREANTDLKKFKALVEASPDFVAIAALDGTVMYVNPGGRRLIGLPPEVDVTTTSIADYLTPEGLAASVEVEQPAVVAEGHWEGESTLRNHRGSAIPVAIASFLMRDPETDEPFALATVQRDITDRLEAETALRDLADQRQALLTRLVDAQDAERTRIAADVHDDPVQALAAVDLRLGMLKRKLEGHADLVESLQALQSSVAGATARLRALLFDLEPPHLQDGLGEALRRACQELFEGTSAAWTVRDDEEPALPESTKAVAYRIAKEALNNARMHAHARSVEVVVSGRDDGLAVSVTDDGVGIEKQPDLPPPGHRGLLTMRDRAAVAGGHCTIRSLPGGGTRVTAWFPSPSSV